MEIFKTSDFGLEECIQAGLQGLRSANSLWWFFPVGNRDAESRCSSNQTDERNRVAAPLKIKDLGPSVFVRSCASKIVAAANTKQILDVGCGAGRNAIYLSRMGCRVVCLDRDVSRLIETQRKWESRELAKKSLDLVSFRIDLLQSPWPFQASTVGGILNVHFFVPALFPFFANSLMPGGYLLLETPPGHGRNYKELPLAGATRFAFEDAFDIEIYKESRVGPPGSVLSRLECWPSA